MDTDWTRYSLDAGAVRAGHSAEPVTDCRRAFALMLARISRAKKYVLLETYNFADDMVGRIFAAALTRKAGEGVPVFVIYDAAGSLDTKTEFFDGLRRAGVAVGEYHPLEPLHSIRNFFRRNHRKMLVVDGLEAFVGGMNITAEFAHREEGGQGWKDCVAHFDGPCVDDITVLFWESWRRCRRTARPVPCEAWSGPVTGGVLAQAVSVSGTRNRRSIRRGYWHAIENASESIYITNAYFLPGIGTIRRLTKAAKRGVDVRLIMPSVTDHPYVRWAAWSIFPKLLRAGIKIYEWQGTVLHAKTAVVDGMWSTVGSHNLDHRSLYYNLELNLNLLGEEFGSKMKAAFEDDLKNCRPVSLSDCKGKGALFNMAGRLLYWLRFLL